MKRFLALDCGGTLTRAGLYNEKKELLASGEGEASNPAESGIHWAVTVMREVGRKLLGDVETIDCVAVGAAGAAKKEIQEGIAAALCDRFDTAWALVSDDRWPLMKANVGSGKGAVIIAGTGSSVLAQSGSDQFITLGGRGPLLGDGGSAYQLALKALRACARAKDVLGEETALLQEMLRAMGHADLSDLALWTRKASKKDIAQLAQRVTACARKGDRVASRIVDAESQSLAEQAVTAFERLSLPGDTPIYLSGGLFEGSTLYLEVFKRSLNRIRPGLVCTLAPLRGHRAVLEMAFPHSPSKFLSRCSRKSEKDLGVPVTEEQILGSTPLDRLSALEIVRFMNKEDSRVPAAVAREEASIAKAIEAVARAFLSGGRLIYTGAGTSGRLGVIDAAECPPTFGVSAEKVVAILAGGDEALRRSVEGVEDDRARGARDLAALDPPLCKKDIVLGIASSGTTPYVLAALNEAREQGALDMLLCSNPASREQASIVIALDTGPEVLAGSTRLKAGTAAKMVLNMISTGAMALSGYIFDGLMVGIKPLNAKLKRRALWIMKALTHVEEAKAEELLEKAQYQIPVAVLMKVKDLDAETARVLLKRSKDSLTDALKEK